MYVASSIFDQLFKKQPPLPTFQITLRKNYFKEKIRQDTKRT